MIKEVMSLKQVSHLLGEWNKRATVTGPNIIGIPSEHVRRMKAAIDAHIASQPKEDDGLTEAYLLGRHDGRKDKGAEQPRGEGMRDVTATLLSYDFSLYLDPENPDSEVVTLVCGFSVDEKAGRQAVFHAEDESGNSIRLAIAREASQPASQPKAATDAQPGAWMRRHVTYRGVDGRREGERIVSEDKVYADDIPLYTHPAPSQAAEDCERLDWLAMQFVDVRVPGVYGSRLAFSGVPKIDIEGLDEAPFDIRYAIDAARIQEKARD